MLYAEYIELTNAGVKFGLDPSIVVGDFRGACAANDFIALRLSAVSTKYARDSSFPIFTTNTTTPYAALLTCKGQPFGYGSATAEMVAAYLIEADKEDVANLNGDERRDFIFRYDYLVISSVEMDEYISKYRTGSGVWGGFTHIEEQPLQRIPYISQSPAIFAKPDLKISLPEQKDAIWRAIDHASPLERFLKQYHLLEIGFDLEVVNQLRALGADLKGVGKLLNDYAGDKEFDRLHKIIRRHCSSIPVLETILVAAFRNAAYHDQLMELLFEYSKDSNPYKEKNVEFLAAIKNGISEQEFKAKKLPWDLAHLSKLVTYIIYRVRSSIAHSKIGEHLLSADDEEFVAEVAEPLLLEVLLLVHG